MELRSLRYFVKIVEFGSLSRAADALSIAQPSLSHQVAQLEEEFGVRLLDRGSKGVKATAAGIALYRCAVSIARQLEEVRGEISAEGGNLAGDVSVGLPTSTAVVLAMPLLRAVVKKYPNICLEINENGSGLLGEWLLHGRLDLAMLFTQGPVKALRCQHLLTEEICLIRARDPNSPPDKDPDSAISVAQLQDERLVLPSKANGLRRVIDEAFALRGVRPRLVAELSMLRMLREAVLGGIASTMLPMSAVADEMRSGGVTVKRLFDPPVLRPLSLCVNANVPLSAAGEAVYATVVETINNLVAEGVWPGVTSTIAPSAGNAAGPA
jgi:LysR family transcriptional regulator, nitrogen assimilation regulatory protein